MLHHEVTAVTPLAQNCSLLWCPETLVAAVVDPGGESGRIHRAVEQRGLRLEAILLTHAHIDHVGAAGALAAATGAPIHGPGRQDSFLLDALPSQAAVFGVPLEQPFTPNRWLADGDLIDVGKECLKVLHCPGHSPGHVVFHHATGGLLFSGDVLFRGSIGRTDLPGGDHRALLASLERLWTLPDATVYVPGHGPGCSLAVERRSNPFCR